MEERSSWEVMIINTWDYPLLEKREASIYYRQVKAEVISNSRQIIHRIWPKPFSRALYVLHFCPKEVQNHRNLANTVYGWPLMFFCSITSSASEGDHALITDENVCFMALFWVLSVHLFVLISPVSCLHKHVSYDALYYVTCMNRP